MTRRGGEYVESLRDGRQIYIDGEIVDDVTRHPAFCESVASVAHLYDVTIEPANAELMTFTSPTLGVSVNRSYMIPATEDDLVLRRKALRRTAEETFGLMGRDPACGASFLAGFAGGYGVFAQGGKEFGENIRRFHEKARDEDLYVTYVIVPPQIDRSKPAHQQKDPYLYAGVKEERDGGIVIKGAQMLGTGAAIANYVYLSCITPLAPGDEAYAIACAIPIGAPGVKVLSRRSYAKGATSVYDYPFSTRFDETDSLLIFDDVFVPWGDVFIYRNLDIVRSQWTETAAHLLGNNQAQIRFWTKLDLLTGLAKRVATMNGSENTPPVRGLIGEIASYASLVAGLVYAQEQNCEVDAANVARPGPAECFANMTLQSIIYPELLETFRDLCGGGLIQLPSSAADFENPEIAAQLDRYVQSPGFSSVERVKILKLAWDLVGSEFAGRHFQYELFYAGAPFLVKMRMFDNYNFERASALVDQAMAGYDLGGIRDGNSGISHR